MSDAPSARELWEWARELLEVDDVDSRPIRAGVLILACCHGCGPRLKCLHRRTGIPVGDVNNVSYRLRHNGIWGPTWFRAPWLEDDASISESLIAFVMQVMTAIGELRSVDGESFSLTTAGSQLGIDSSVPWRNLVPLRPLPVTGPEPWWLGRAA